MHRTALFSVAVLVICTWSTVTAAQTPDPSPPEQTPPIAPAATVKTERGFMSALVHDLGNDLKHLPRMSSVYWLAAGVAGVLAIRPADRTINRHLVGSSCRHLLQARQVRRA
jgi:hypothetical protein